MKDYYKKTAPSTNNLWKVLLGTNKLHDHMSQFKKTLRKTPETPNTS